MMNASLAWNRALDVTLSLRDKNDVRKPKGDITRFKLLLTDKRFMNTETEFLIDQAKILLVCPSKKKKKSEKSRYRVIVNLMLICSRMMVSKSCCH